MPNFKIASPESRKNYFFSIPVTSGDISALNLECPENPADLFAVVEKKLQGSIFSLPGSGKASRDQQGVFLCRNPSF